jgi:hypothetical protein
MLPIITPSLLCSKPVHVASYLPKDANAEITQSLGLIINYPFIMPIIGVRTPKGLIEIISILSLFYFNMVRV